MSSKKVAPTSALAAFLSWNDPMILEDVSDGSPSDNVPDVLKRSHDSRVSPAGILVSEANDELTDLYHDSGTTAAPTSREIVLHRDQLAVPAENGIRKKQGRDPEQGLPANGLRFHGKTAPLVVVESRTLRAVQLEKDSVLFNQVVDDVGLVAIQPTRGCRNDHLQRRKDFIHARDGTRSGYSKRR